MEEHECIEHIQTDYLGFDNKSGIGHCIICGTAYCYTIKNHVVDKLISYVRVTLIKGDTK